MFDLLFGKKDEKGVEKLKDDTKKGFEGVKKDISSAGVWIKHLDSETKMQQEEINEIKGVLSSGTNRY